MASADGYFYMFDVNTNEGGICKLLTQASLYTANTNIIFNPATVNPNNGKDPQQQLIIQQQQQQQQQQQFLQQNNPGE
jgi:hypothetical protein